MALIHLEPDAERSTQQFKTNQAQTTCHGTPRPFDPATKILEGTTRGAETHLAHVPALS